MSNEKNSQNKSGELKKPPYVTRTNQPWTTVFAEDLNTTETKLDLSQFVKVEKVQDDEPVPTQEAKKNKADTVNKGNVQNVTPIPAPEHKFRPKDSSQQSKPSDEFETKPVMEEIPTISEEKPAARTESNKQDDDGDSFVSPSFGGFKNPYADEEPEEKPEDKKPAPKETEDKVDKPKATAKSHKSGNVILGVSCVVLAASVVIMGMTIAESRKSDSIVYPSTGSTLNISADVATTDTNFENQEALTPVVSMTSDGNTWTLNSSTFLITDGESKVAVAVDSADSIKYDGAALQYERNGVTYLVRMVSDSSYLGNSTMTEHEDGATHMITGIEGIGNGKVLVVIATYGATGDESINDAANEEVTALLSSAAPANDGASLLLDNVPVEFDGRTLSLTNERVLVKDGDSEVVLTPASYNADDIQFTDTKQTLSGFTVARSDYADSDSSKTYLVEGADQNFLVVTNNEDLLNSILQIQ
jgi:hypothetical protein